MPGRRGARRGATARRGRNAGRGRNARVEDEASHRGDHSDNQAERQEGEIPQPGNQNPPNPFMADFVAALAAQNFSIQPPRADTSTREIELVREFRRMDPPKFDGRVSDPLAADHWLSEIREQFEVLGIKEDELRIRLITCQLVGEAKVWWQSVRTERRDARRGARAALGIDEPDVENMTWAEFEKKFDDQYFPRSFKAQLRIQFEKLEQGSTSVSEYVVQFQSLARFAPELVSNEEMKCWRFIRGLSPNIRRFMLGSKQEVFAEVAEFARTLESDEEETRRARRSESRPSGVTMNASSGGFGNQNRKRMRDSFQTTSNRSNLRPPSSVGFGGSMSRSSGMQHGA